MKSKNLDKIITLGIKSIILIASLIIITAPSIFNSQRVEAATKKVQDVSAAGSLKIAAPYVKDTWYVLTNQLDRRNYIIIRNNGVNNDLTTGIIYVSILNTATTETGAVTLARIIPLSAGQSVSGNFTADVYFHVQADTANACILFFEADSENADIGLKDS